VRNNIICVSLQILTGLWHAWGGKIYNKDSLTVESGNMFLLLIKWMGWMGHVACVGGTEIRTGT
jgi:hypothetical protein